MGKKNLYTVVVTTVRKYTIWAHSKQEAAEAKRYTSMRYERTKDVEVIRR